MVNTLMGSLFIASLKVTPGNKRAHSMCAQLPSLVRLRAPPRIGHKQHIYVTVKSN